MMTRKNYSSKKGGRKTNKRYSSKKGGINWKFWEKKPVDTAVAAPTEPTAPAPAPTCPPCPVCQQQPVTPAAAEAIKEERAMRMDDSSAPASSAPASSAPASSAPPALESQLGGKRKRKTRRTKKSKKSKKLWFQIGCVKL